MKKYLSICLTAVLMVCMLVISGCGQDKIEGKWSGMASNRPGICAVNIEFQKNGNSYIIKEKTVASPLLVSSGNKTGDIDVLFLEYNKFDGASVTVKDNILTIKKGAGTATATYNEKDGTITMPDEPGNEHLVLQKDNDGKIYEENVQKVEEFAKDDFTKRYPNATPNFIRKDK